MEGSRKGWGIARESNSTAEMHLVSTEAKCIGYEVDLHLRITSSLLPLVITEISS
jgi:hypothetical protein